MLESLSRHKKQEYKRSELKIQLNKMLEMLLIYMNLTGNICFPVNTIYFELEDTKIKFISQLIVFSLLQRIHS